MARIIEFHVPKSLRQKIAPRSLEYGKLIEFRLGMESPDDDSDSSVNRLTLFGRVAFQWRRTLSLISRHVIELIRLKKGRSGIQTFDVSSQARTPGVVDSEHEQVVANPIVS